MTSTGNRSRVARMVAQLFTHYAKKTCGLMQQLILDMLRDLILQSLIRLYYRFFHFEWSGFLGIFHIIFVCV